MVTLKLDEKYIKEVLRILNHVDFEKKEGEHLYTVNPGIEQLTVQLGWLVIVRTALEERKV